MNLRNVTLWLIPVLWMASCRTMPILPARITDLPDSPISLSMSETPRPAFRTNILPVPPENIIDDFETGLDLWTVSASSGSRMTLKEVPADMKGRKALQIRYELPRRKQWGLVPDQALIRIHKEADFERYTGIQFLARGNERTPVRITLFEYNHVAKDLDAYEVWYKEIVLTSEWRMYRLAFDGFSSEEYFEQGYIGNDQQELPRIKDVGFSIHNMKALDYSKGTIEIDDVLLF